DHDISAPLSPEGTKSRKGVRFLGDAVTGMFDRTVMQMLFLGHLVAIQATQGDNCGRRRWRQAAAAARNCPALAMAHGAANLLSLVPASNSPGLSVRYSSSKLFTSCGEMRREKCAGANSLGWSNPAAPTNSASASIVAR